MISVSELNTWVEDAQRTLLLAQKICSEAEVKLQSISYELTQRFPRKVSYVSNIFAVAKEHQKRCTAVVEKCKPRQGRSGASGAPGAPGAPIAGNGGNGGSGGTAHPDAAFGLEKVDTSAKDALMLVISQLKATRVPDYVLNPTATAGGGGGGGPDSTAALSDFISMDSIDLLRSNVEGYEANYQRIAQMTDDEFRHLVAGPFSAGSKKYTKLLKSYNDVMYEVNTTSSNTLKQILKENGSLEGELATILQQLTKHYDQCVKARDIAAGGGGGGLSGTDGVELEVLENDVYELPEVANELQNINDVILHNDGRARELCSTRLSMLSALELDVERQIEFYKDFKDNNVLKFITIYAHAKNQITKIENPAVESNLETINQLVYHYKNFLSVYKHNFYAELHYERYVYPRKFLSKLKKFLNDELDQISKQERERRRAWLDKYGDFIPKEFKLPGEADQPAIVQVITEGLDEIGSEDPDIEMKILNMIAK